MKKVVGLILCGGRSSRMGGGEKALLNLEGRVLVDRSLERLRPMVEAVAINANREVEAYATRGVPVLSDVIGGYQGPLAGVLTGLRWASDKGASHLVSVAGDTPFFPADLGSRLSASVSDATPIAMAQSADGRHPTFAIWPTALADDLEAALKDGTRKIIAWSDAKGCSSVQFDSDGFDPFFNVNTPDDMATAARMVSEHGL